MLTALPADLTTRRAVDCAAIRQSQEPNLPIGATLPANREIGVPKHSAAGYSGEYLIHVAQLAVERKAVGDSLLT